MFRWAYGDIGGGERLSPPFRRPAPAGFAARRGSTGAAAPRSGPWFSRCRLPCQRWSWRAAFPEHFSRVRHVAIALDGIISAQGIPVPIVRKQNAPQVGVTREADSKEIEDFAFQPVRPRPDRNQGIHHRIIAGQAYPQPRFLALRDGNQVVAQFESWLRRVTVHARRVAKEVVLQLGILAAAFRRGAKKFAGHDNRRLAPEFNDFCNCFGVPRTQPFLYNITVFSGTLRHTFSIH